MEYLHSLLKFALDHNASDIHIKAAHFPTIRVSGELFPVQVDPPANDLVDAIVRHMLPRHLDARLEREREVDFSYYIPNFGRYRVNVFSQRGELCLAMRYVKTNIPSFTDLHLPRKMKLPIILL